MGGMKDKEHTPNTGRIKVTFRDDEQDCLEWILQDGVVVDCDMQRWMWVGTRVTQQELWIGDGLDVVFQDGHTGTWKHPMVKIEKLEEAKDATVVRH